VVDFELDIAKQQVNRLAVTATGTLALNLDLEVTVGGTLNLAQEFDLSGPTATLYTYTFVIFVPTIIGPLPIAGTIDLDAFAGFSANVTAMGTLTSGVEGSTSFSLHAGYQQGAWSVEGVPSFDSKLHPPKVTTIATADARAYVRPELRVRFYGVAGPYASVTPALKAAVTATPMQSAKFEGCISGDIGFDVTLFGRQLLDLAHAFPEQCRPLALP
jgi:hypothetical protein